MVDNKEELIDLMKPLRPLFTWLRRPMRYYLGRRAKVLAHGVGNYVLGYPS